MMFSAQNSSGVHWCRRRVRFNEVPEKVAEKVAEKVPGNPLLGIPPRFFFPARLFLREPGPVTVFILACPQMC